MTKFLAVVFFLLQYIALWQPVQWPSGWKTHAYKLFTTVTVIFYFIDMGSQIYDFFRIAKTLSDYANNSFILLTMIGIAVKIINMIVCRKEIVELVIGLQSGSFLPRNVVEDDIRKQFESHMKWRTIFFSIFMQMGTVNLIITSIINLVPHRQTITHLYLPWNQKSFTGFWITFGIQCISRWFDGLVIVACDGLVSGIMYRAAAQFKILQLRIKALSTIGQEIKRDKENMERLEMEKITDLVEQHLEIIQVVSKLNDIFGFVVFSQYFISSTVLCVTVFVFSQVKVFDTRTAMLITYTGCMYFQVYLLCSAGNEMTQQSTNFSLYIYTSDWEELSIKTKKSLLLMMKRSGKPLKFTSWQLIELSIASFAQIVKFSYTAYNVLAQSQ